MNARFRFAANACLLSAVSGLLVGPTVNLLAQSSGGRTPNRVVQAGGTGSSPDEKDDSADDEETPRFLKPGTLPTSPAANSPATPRAPQATTTSNSKPGSPHGSTGTTEQNGTRKLSAPVTGARPNVPPATSKQGAIRQTAGSTTGPVQGGTAPKTAVQRELEEMYKRDGREMPNMNLNEVPVDGTAPVAPPAAAAHYNAPKVAPPKQNIFKRMLTSMGLRKERPAPQAYIPQPGIGTRQQAPGTPYVVSQQPVPKKAPPPQQQAQADATKPRLFPGIDPTPPAAAPGSAPASAADTSAGVIASKSAGTNSPVVEKGPPVNSKRIADDDDLDEMDDVADDDDDMDESRIASQEPAAKSSVESGAASQPAKSHPLASNSSTSKAPSDQPASSQPASNQPATSQPVASQPASEPKVASNSADSPYTGLKLIPNEADGAKIAKSTEEVRDEKQLDVNDDEDMDVEQPKTQHASQTTSPEDQQKKRQLQLLAAHSELKGLKGFCSVTLKNERQLAVGKAEFKSEYQSKTYVFATAAAKAEFDSSPEKYAPAFNGADVVCLADKKGEVEGSLQHAAWYKGRLYLFSSLETRDRFVEAPKQFVPKPPAL